jgi:hypothetical protein
MIFESSEDSRALVELTGYHDDENSDVVLHSKKYRSTTTSKTTKALQTVLGNLPEIIELERLRTKLSSKKSSRYYLTRYETQLAWIQTAVLRAVNECKLYVKGWEKETFCKTGSAVYQPPIHTMTYQPYTM